MRKILLAFLVLLCVSPSANAQFFRRASRQPVRYQQTVQYRQTYAVQLTGNEVPSFVAWMNGTRAKYGMAAVGWDQNLANWASQNNVQQNSRGIGHYVMGPARRQNAAMTYNPSVQLASMWWNSPAHRALILDPTIRSVGLAGSGAFWTLNGF